MASRDALQDWERCIGRAYRRVVEAEGAVRAAVERAASPSVLRGVRAELMVTRAELERLLGDHAEDGSTAPDWVADWAPDEVFVSDEPAAPRR